MNTNPQMLISLSSTLELLSQANCCYYIPAYQRDFSWDREHVERYFESLVAGMHAMTDRDELSTETFMGTIVCFEDFSPYSSVKPFVVNDTPLQLLSLIDGQQRMTISITVAICLHEFLEEELKQMESSNKKELQELKNQQIDIISELKGMFTSQVNKNDRKPYPRIIKGQIDKWSSSSDQLQYISPIAMLINNYQKEGIAELDSTEKLIRLISEKNLESEKAKIIKSHRIYNNALNTVKNLIQLLIFEPETSQEKEITEQGFERLTFEPLPEIVALINAHEGELQRKLLGMNTPCDFLKNLSGDELVLGKRVARLVLIASYFLKKIKYIRLITRSDTYAYSIFDSLNTTGDPLTAYETFRAEIIHGFHSIVEYNNSQQRLLFDEIDAFLTVDSKKQERITKQLIVNFALAESGTKLSDNNVNAQRKYMFDQYKSQSENEKIKFIENLRNVARVMDLYINYANRSDNLFFSVFSDALLIHSDDEFRTISEAVFCLKLLVEAGHTITIALVSRFYTQLIERNRDDKALFELCRAICSTAAFFALWRISRETTDRIDDNHRLIIRSYCRQAKCKVTLILLSQRYYYFLENNRRPIVINDKLSENEWVALSSEIPIYRVARNVAKFLLLINTYWRKNNSPQEILHDFLWDEEAHRTIDHVIPRKEENNTATSAGEKQILHCIGNLTLLPRQSNSYIKDKHWEKGKRIIYVLLSGLDVDKSDKQEAQQLINTYLKLKNHIEMLASKDKRLLLPIQEVAKIQIFVYQNAKERSDEILRAVWPCLIKWL